MSELVRLLVALLVGAVGLVGLLMSLCGGFFTAMSLANGKINDTTSTISIPSLLIGGAIAWAAFRYLTRSSRAAHAAPPAQPDRDEGPPG